MKPKMTTNQFDAPWSRLLRLMTTFCLIVCFGVASIGIVVFPAEHPFARLNMIAVPLLILLGGSLFMVRGYTLDNGRLIIQRLGWSSHLDLAGLPSASHDPTAMAGSIRLAGNGGLFAFSGWFRNQKLGRYRVFATDPDRSVVLRFADQIVVVTPDAPDRFVEEIMKRKGGSLEG